MGAADSDKGNAMTTLDKFDFSAGLTPDVFRAFFVHCYRHGVSDIHLQSGGPLVLGHHGRKIRASAFTLDHSTLLLLIDSLFSPLVKARIQAGKGDDAALQLEGDSQQRYGLERGERIRFRANFTQATIRGLSTAIAVTLRVINNQIPALNSLGLPDPLYQTLAHLPVEGIGLIVGPTGSGKTTLLTSVYQHHGETTPDCKVTPADPVLPEPVPAVHAAAESVAAVNAAPETPLPDTTVGASPAAPAKKARRTKKTAPAEAKEKGSAKPATAPKKPRQKKVTTDDKPEKPQQAAPAAADSQSATRADPMPSLSSLLKQESPPASPIPASEDEENQPVTPSMNESAPPLRKADTSGTDENGTPDNDAPVTDAMPEPDGIRFERSQQARERIDLVALEGALLHKPGNERGTQQYLLDGERAFTRYLQQGRIIMATPQASQNDRMILGALLVAKQDMVLQGNIELTGSPAFKQRAINLIAEYDLPLKLTNPEQIKMLEDAREKLRSEPGLPDEPTPLGSEASEILVHPVGNNTSAPRSSAPVAAQAASTQRASTDTLPPDILPQKAPAPVPMNASHDEASAGLTGTLLEHGAAPYNFRKDESHSYYARLRTAEGERVVWGITLRAAIADAGLNNNDLVTLQMTGKETVTVDVKQKGEDGKPLLDGKGQPIYRKEERERNKWTARQAIDPTVVSADTRSMTPPGELLAYSLKDWNTLQAGVEELAKKAGVSLPDWPGLPDALWMEPAGKGVPSPDRRPDNPALPAPSRDAGKALFQAMDAEQQLKLLLVKAHGDYVQGVVLHDDVYKPVLGRLCKNARGAPHMTLNEITPDGLKPLGYGNPINNDTGSFNDYVFRLNNEPQRLYAQGLEPEKRPAALQQQLGFDSAPVAPDQLVVRREPESGHRHTPTMPRPGH